MSLNLARLGSIASGLLLGSGDFDHIASITVGSGGASNIEFSNIPSTYQHLQVQGFLQASDAGDGWGIVARANSDSTFTNYRGHYFYGSGSSALASSVQSSTWTGLYSLAVSGNATNAGTIVVFDLLDYSSTSKNKTSISFIGWEKNGTGNIGIASAVWLSTAAISSLNFFIAAGKNFAQDSTLSLYGIKS